MCVAREVHIFFGGFGDAVAGEFWRIVDRHEVKGVAGVLHAHWSVLYSRGVRVSLGKVPRGNPGRYPLVVEARLNVTIGIRIFTMWEVILYGMILANVQLSTVAS